MSILNIFEYADTIQVGYNSDTGYFLNIKPKEGAAFHFTTGSAAAAGMILLANSVDHFDYHGSLFNNSDAMDSFIRETRAVGFAA